MKLNAPAIAAAMDDLAISAAAELMAEIRRACQLRELAEEQGNDEAVERADEIIRFLLDAAQRNLPGMAEDAALIRMIGEAHGDANGDIGS